DKSFRALRLNRSMQCPQTEDRAMITSETLAKLFPLERDIPAEHRLAAPIQQRTWLVKGELRTWNGTCKTVLSPVCVRSPGNELKQLEIGSYPVMGETQSDEALDAAVAAYDNGRGEWPTMPVADRLDCMQDFVKQMMAQRRTVTQLIMWEIGKSGVRPDRRLHFRSMA